MIFRLFRNDTLLYFVTVNSLINFLIPLDSESLVAGKGEGDVIIGSEVKLLHMGWLGTTRESSHYKGIKRSVLVMETRSLLFS